MEYKVPEEKLLELIEAAIRLTALENGGVDNWTWYYESLSDYRDNYFDGITFAEIAKDELQEYKKCE